MPRAALWLSTVEGARTVRAYSDPVRWGVFFAASGAVGSGSAAAGAAFNLIAMSA